VEAWAQVKFDHARTGFPLTASHARVPCKGCHPVENGALAFTGRPNVCSGCHKDPHGGRFARAGRTDCARCHEPTQWLRVVNFDHDHETSFKLEGAHRTVPCAGCHQKQGPDGKPVMRYTGIGKACVDCHAGGAAPLTRSGS
jgi:hypothetical protein